MIGDRIDYGLLMQVPCMERPSRIGRTMRSARGDQAAAVDLDSIYRTGEVVGDAWSWLVMRESVLYDVRRFSQFQARLGLARSTLAACLRQLTSGGQLTEHPRASGPEYHPTESGSDFFACLMVAMRWSDRGTSRHARVRRRRYTPAAADRSRRYCVAQVPRGDSAHNVTARRPGPFTTSSRLGERRRTPICLCWNGTGPVRSPEP